jgi:hypothetical protein
MMAPHTRQKHHHYTSLTSRPYTKTKRYRPEKATYTNHSKEALVAYDRALSIKPIYNPSSE